MSKKLAAIILFVFVFSFATIFAQEKTEINSAKAKTMLLGRHRFSLQWISWNYFGTASVTNRNSVFYLKGEQNGRGSSKGDYLTIDGTISSVSEKEFTFNGKIVTRVSHINGGNPCEREGEMTFAITNNRRYWRLREMQNSCEDVLDYVDIFFR